MFHAALSTSLWMGDLDEDTDEQTIINAFAHFGEAVMSIKNKKPPKGKLFGSCFVEFSDVDAAQRVLHKLNGKFMPGRSGQKRFKLNPASYGRSHELLPEFSLYVGDLSTDVDDYALFEFFQKRYKSVRGAKVVSEKGRSKGYGFIRFSEESDQQKALIEMQHMTGLGRRPIKVSLASIKRPNEIPSIAPPGPPPPSHSSYYAGHYSWGGYNYHYNQSYSQPTSTLPHYETPSAYPDSYPEPAAPMEDDDSEVLEDPCLEVNVGKENREFIESSESFFCALENSRWQPLDNLMSEVPD